MFGIKFLRQKNFDEIQESMAMYQRTLEDIGWINLSLSDQTDLAHLIPDGFEQMLKRVRIYYYNNPLAGQWVHLTTSFIFGEGIGIPKAKDDDIQEVLEEFWNDKDNKKVLTTFQAQQKLSNKLQYEGNLYFVLFTDEEGKVRVRVLNAVEVKDIIPDEEDRNRPLFYKVGRTKKKYNYALGQYETNQIEIKFHPDVENEMAEGFNIPLNKRGEGTIYHVKINCDLNDKFGIPTLYRGLDWMKAHKDMAGDMATLIKSLSRFAWQKKVKGGTASVNSIANALKSKQDLSNFKHAAGQIQVENEGIDTKAFSTPTGGVKIASDGLKNMQLMVSSASGLMYHYFGDPSTGNLATAKTMELPMIKHFLAWQKLWEGIFEDILQYQIDRKIEIGLLPGRTEFDPKTKRTIIETDKDRGLDIDFPPVVDEDLKPIADALGAAKNNGLISSELASQLFMLAANVDNIEEEVEKALAELEQKKIEEQEKFQMETDIKKMGLNIANTIPKPTNNPNAPKKVAKTVKEAIDKVMKEAIEAPAKNTGRNEDRLFRKNNFVNQRMNAYTKALASAYGTFGKRIKENSKVSQKKGDPAVGTIQDLDQIVLNLVEDMKKAANRFFPEAVEIGKKYALAEMKRLGAGVTFDSLTEDFGDATGILEDRIAWNNEFLDNSLAPDVTEKFTVKIRDSYPSVSLYDDAIDGALQSLESRVNLYAGAFWTVEESAVKATASGSGLMANYAGPIDERNSPGCREAALNNPYPVEDVPIPGSFESGMNCRHAIQLIEKEKE